MKFDNHFVNVFVPNAYCMIVQIETQLNASFGHDDFVWCWKAINIKLMAHQ